MAEQAEDGKHVWVHIGAPKTGSTSIQRVCRDRTAFLAQHDIQLVKRRRLGSVNALAIALRNRWEEDIAKYAAEIEAIIEASEQKHIVMSSEMLTRCLPADMVKAIPSLQTKPPRLRNLA